MEPVAIPRPHEKGPCVIVCIVFDAMIERLGDAVPDPGRDTAGDATALNARRKKAARAEAEEEQGLPQATGGRKEYTDDEGKVNKVVEWFGFKLHLLVDVKHEVSLSYKITDTKAGDGVTLPAILGDAQTNLPPGRIKTLAYDKAADTNDVHQLLSKANITPVIQNRSLWKKTTNACPLDLMAIRNIVYDEAGTVYCYDRQEPAHGTPRDVLHRSRTATPDHQVSLPGDAQERGVSDGKNLQCRKVGLGPRPFRFRKRSTYVASLRCLVRRRSSSVCTKVGRRWSE